MRKLYFFNKKLKAAKDLQKGELLTDDEYI